MARAWAFISIAEGRQYGGNLGYNDDLRKAYRYDSSVPNHLQVNPGDLVFIRGRAAVFGMARIKKITTSDASKARYRCPICRTPQIKARSHIVPRWRCVDGHTFDDPSMQLVNVKAYDASYGDSFIDLDKAISVVDLKRTAIRPSDQLSIEEIDAAKLMDRIASAAPAARSLLEQYLQSTQPDPAGYGPLEQGVRLDNDNPYSPALGDTREKINRSIAARRGQRAFRRNLLRRYGPSCMITGCQLLEIVEAAHIWPYRGDEDNHPENGLLLRADLHTLFDLDLLGINPNDMGVWLHPEARDAGYNHLEGLQLRLHGKSAPAAPSLAARWTSFVERLG